MFSSARIFGGLEAERSDYLTSQFVIVPVPYDATTTYRSGTRDGPRAIIDASLQMELWTMAFTPFPRWSLTLAVRN